MSPPIVGLPLIVPDVAGYSGTPLGDKLGLKPGHVVVQLGGPEELLPGVPVRRRLPRAADVVLFFITERAAN